MHPTTDAVAEPAHAVKATHAIVTAQSDSATTAKVRRKRGRPERFTPAQVIEALEAASGVKNAAAELLKTSGPVIAGHIMRHADVREAFDRIKAVHVNAN